MENLIFSHIEFENLQKLEYSKFVQSSCPMIFNIKRHWMTPILQLTSTTIYDQLTTQAKNTLEQKRNVTLYLAAERCCDPSVLSVPTDQKS